MKTFVAPGALAVHADLDVLGQQDLREVDAGELRTLVRIEDFWFPEAAEGLLYGLDAEIGLHRDR